LAAAQRQARDVEARIRAFLADQPVVTTGFAAELIEAAHGFADLPLVLNIDGISHEPPQEVIKAVRGAVETILHNVRRYASASEVVLYAEAGLDRWDVSVHDDGVGFDPGRTPEGYGLGKQVREAIHEVGGEVRIESAPQAGTLIQLSGGRAPAETGGL
jgi:signal transduction histidine kinase